MAEPQLGAVPFAEAIAHLRQKVRLPTARSDDLHGRVHAKAFTVAGAQKAGLLTDLHEAIVAARAGGQSIGQFRKAFDEIVTRHGWSYHGKRGWRTRVIYDTNMATSAMAGQWQQFQSTAGTRPYLQYQTVGDGRVRPQHRAWHGTVRPIGDGFWDSHYPPNGWGCRCTVRSLSDVQMQRDGLEVSPTPAVKLTERINTQTGEVYGKVPVGIDVGWDYNVGKAWLGPDFALADAIKRLPAATQAAALAESATLSGLHQTAPFNAWLPRAAAGEIQTAGWLPAEAAVATLEAAPASRPLIVVAGDTAASLGHALQDLPLRLADLDAVLQDGDTLIAVPRAGAAFELRPGRDGAWYVTGTRPAVEATASLKPLFKRR